ncbi:MAG TPA: hypothetical protein VKA35_00400 [Solirubrobacterales bacterium]|nr:hypothetical protein [Solirubrobacterales bacterium]
MAGLADAGAAIENRAAGVEGDDQRDQRQQRREDEQDRRRDDDVERPQDRVDRTGVALRCGRDEFFEAGFGLGQLVQEGVTG